MPAPPKRIILDLDATDDPLHGHQEGRFFHGYYDCYCYLPLYVFCGRHLLAAKLRRSNIDASAGAVEEIARIVAPDPRALARGAHHPAGRLRLCPRGADGVVRGERRRLRVRAGRNDRLVAKIERRAGESRRAGGRAQTRRRRAASRTSSGHARQLEPPRRVIGKAEWTQRRGQPALHRHLARCDARRRALPLRGRLLRPRRHGEPHQGVPARSLSPTARRRRTMRANQLRLWFASMAYVLMCALRRIGLAGHRAGAGDLRHHPSEAPEDRRAGDHQRAPRQDRVGLGLPHSKTSSPPPAPGSDKPRPETARSVRPATEAEKRRACPTRRRGDESVCLAPDRRNNPSSGSLPCPL